MTNPYVKLLTLTAGKNNQEHGYERGHIMFILPDGQRVEVLLRLMPAEIQSARWEASTWLVNDDQSTRRLANFEFPLDTSVYPA